MVVYEINCNNNEYNREYGINALIDGEIVKSIFEISNNKQDILKLVNICNTLNLELCHLDDIIEDYLTDFEI